MRVLAISGSLRARSHNTALLRAAARLAPPTVAVEILDGLAELPPYNEDHDTDTPPPAVARLRERIAAADALLIATPEYNGSLPGHLKQAIDWASRPYGQGASLWGKPALVIGASVTDYGALWAQEHLRKALGIAGARVLEDDLAVGRAPERFGPEGELVDETVRGRLAELLGQLEQATQSTALAA